MTHVFNEYRWGLAETTPKNFDRSLRRDWIGEVTGLNSLGMLGAGYIGTETA